MAIGAYTNPDWANGGTPAINSANLQAATDQIKNITDAAVSGGASPTKIWTSTNDGNGGQPPAPKPRAATDSDIGQFKSVQTATNNAGVAPAGGVWAWFGGYYTTATNVALYTTGGVIAGGGTYLAANVTYGTFAILWRVS
jgi:hypothetical protein